MPRPDKAEHAFELLLRAAVTAIRKSARGRSCGQCAHFHFDECGRPDLEWTVHVCAEAVACSKFRSAQ